ncbi:hypothetical protein NLI96_g9143 [Meripilus lineatus]|uniref:Integrase catalytic domain-containing protein n=1 Tax=Meripilus lineatus TaxID=2056292 RepID=A0AAD5YBC1_9APHY|nr:hypothetical protein NLI96_g9143 [Physisporinus lineatus]
MFKTYTPTPGEFIKGAGNCPALGRGTVNLQFSVDGNHIPITLKDVIHAPNMPHNLISLGRITSAGLSYFGIDDDLMISDKDRIIARGHKFGNLYAMDVIVPIQSYAIRTGRSWYEWHCALGHLNKAQLMDLRSLSEGMDVDETSDPDFHCEPCITAKQTRLPFPQASATEYTEIGQLTHFDIWGPARTTSIHGNTYFITFTDAASRFTAVYFMKSRATAFDRFKQYKNFIKLQSGKDLKKLRVDNAKEYVEGNFRKFLDDEGIVLEATAPYSPPQNGVAERLNRTLIEHSRAMLIAKNLPTFLWEDAVAYSNFLRNRSPTRALKKLTPFEAFWGKKPNLGNIQIFGSDCWVLTPDSKRSKLDPKSEKFPFMGLGESGAGWNYYNTRIRQVLTSRNVVFQRFHQIPAEDYGSIPAVQAPPPIVTTKTVSLEGEPNTVNKTAGSRSATTPVPSKIDIPDTPVTIFHTPKSSPSTPANSPSIPGYQRPTRSAAARTNYKILHDSGTRVSGPNPKGFDGDSTNLCFLAHSHSDDEPISLADTKSRSDWQDWFKAMETEVDQLHQLKTYTIEDLPPGRKAVGCRWVFTLKRDANGNVIKHKARLVAQGFSQIPGQDFSATYAPVMRLESFRTLLALAAHLDLEVHQMDVVGAYLNSDLDEEIFMRQPPGFEDGFPRVCRLQKAIYGLKQAGRAWNLKFNHIFVDVLSYKRIHPDYCVYIKHFDGSNFIIVIIHVDDMALLGNSADTISRAKSEITPLLKISDLGEIKSFVGLKITRDRAARTITISQPHYIDTILARFHMESSHPVSTPLDPHVKFVAGDTPPDSDIPYQAAIGSLMYAAVATRPDIAFAVQTLSQFNTRYSNTHWTAVKHVLRYLKGTRDLGITYGTGDLTLFGYSDADWAQNISDRRSISGFAFLLAGGAISWSSKKQATVALSTMEAEYLALAHASKEALWLRSLLEHLHFEISGETPIFCDNQSTIAFAHDHQFHARSKHIDIRHHFIRDHINQKTITVPHVATQDNVADVLTKALPRDAHTRHTQALGLSAH